jgi:hypothetical protein
VIILYKTKNKLMNPFIIQTLGLLAEKSLELKSQRLHEHLQSNPKHETYPEYSDNICNHKDFSKSRRRTVSKIRYLQRLEEQTRGVPAKMEVLCQPDSSISSLSLKSSVPILLANQQAVKRPIMTTMISKQRIKDGKFEEIVQSIGEILSHQRSVRFRKAGRDASTMTSGRVIPQEQLKSIQVEKNRQERRNISTQTKIEVRNPQMPRPTIAFHSGIHF